MICSIYQHLITMILRCYFWFHRLYLGQEYSRGYHLEINKLYTNFQFAFRIMYRIGLPPQAYEIDAGTNVTISGWGALAAGGPSPLDLQYVEIPIVDREICANAYR